MTPVCCTALRELPGVSSTHINIAPLLMRKIAEAGRKHVAITNGGDWPVDDRLAATIADNVVHWFSTNVTVDHPRISGIPVGIGDPCYPHGDYAAIEAHRNDEPQRLLFACYATDTNATEREAATGAALANFSDDDATIGAYPDHSERPLSFERYISLMALHEFVLSPPGNGIDCHRTWEALYLGRIPICKRSRAMSFFGELPILFVDNWSEVTPERLVAARDELKGRPTRMLDLGFWQERIGSYL